MVRVILCLNRADHINMRKERDKIKMLSVNQMSVYHTVIEALEIVMNEMRKLKESADFFANTSHDICRCPGV